MKRILCWWLAVLGLIARAQDASTNSPVTVVPPPPPRPSVILIQFHGLGYGDLSCYGQKLFQTPNLDKLAAEGLRGLNYFAGNIGSTPSPGLLMYGKNSAAAANESTLAKWFQRSGYRTGLIGEWTLGTEPWRQGFDEFAGYLHDDEGRNYFTDFIWRYDPKGNVDWTNNTVSPWVGREMIFQNTENKKGRYMPEILVSAACNFIGQYKPDSFNQFKPFFLMLNLPAPRPARAGSDDFTVTSDAPFSEEKWPQAAKNRTALINRLDGSIGRIMNELLEKKLTNNVLLIVTSSAPPEKFANTNLNFLLPNGTAVAKGNIAGPLPFLARWPGMIPEKTVLSADFSSADLAATLLEVAGQKPPETFSGRSKLLQFTSENGEK